MPVGDPVTDYDGLRQHDIALKQWLDGNLVHKSGTEAETIGGIKTYSSSPLVPTPADNDDSAKAANTAWVKGQFADLHIPLWIGENGIGTEFYVDGTNGDDSTGDGSQSKPWKTIAHAAETLASNYNINSQTCHINVSAGTYTDRINLPVFTRTTGSIIIRPVSASDTVGITITLNNGGTAIRHTGGVWEMQDLDLKFVAGPQTTESDTFRTFIRSEDQSGALTLTHCNYEFEDNSREYSAGTYGHTIIRMISSNGGQIRLQNKSSARECSLSGTAMNADVDWLYATYGGLLRGENSGSNGNPYVFNVSGSYRIFCFIDGGIYRNNGTPVPTWAPIDSPAGRRYSIGNGGQIITGISSPSDAREYFPGDSAGSIAASGGQLSPALSDNFSPTPIYSTILAIDITFSDTEPYTIQLPNGPYSQVDAWFQTSSSVNTAVLCQVNYENGAVAQVRGGGFINTSERINDVRAFQTGGLSQLMVCNAAATAGALAPSASPKTVVFTGGTGVVSLSFLNAAEGTATLPAGTVITIYGAK